MKDRATAALRLYEAVLNRKMYAPPGEYFVGIVGAALGAMKADSLEWAAGWIEGSVPPDADARLREFAANMAMTIRSQVEVAARPEERRTGHTALRVRDGKLEVFDKHPERNVDAAAKAWIQSVQVMPVLPPNAYEGFLAGAAWTSSPQKETK